jgi:hypothetical protein
LNNILDVLQSFVYAWCFTFSTPPALEGGRDDTGLLFSYHCDLVVVFWLPCASTLHRFLMSSFVFGRISEHNTPDDEGRSTLTGSRSLCFFCKGVYLGQQAGWLVGWDVCSVLLSVSSFFLFLFNLLLLLSSAFRGGGANIMIHQLHSYHSSRSMQHVCLVTSRGFWANRAHTGAHLPHITNQECCISLVNMFWSVQTLILLLPVFPNTGIESLPLSLI